MGLLRPRRFAGTAQTGTGQPLLRIYWFDGAPDRVPRPEHRRLRVVPRGTGMAYG
nr:hypothetical protein [Streptomyces sp. CB01580]